MTDPPVPLSLVVPVKNHYYVSTYCVHELHGDCRLACKHCNALCLCSCHLSPVLEKLRHDRSATVEVTVPRSDG